MGANIRITRGTPSPGIPYSWKILRAPIFEDFEVFFAFLENFILENFCSKVIAKLTAKLCHVAFNT